MANGETAVYTPPEWAQIKTCAVDFDSRALAAPVHLVQYDRTMPVLEVELYRKGEPYAVPAGADINIRMDKKDGHHIYSPALGLSADRTKAYIAVTPQMTTTAGTLYPIIEVMANGGVASTSPLRLQFDPNPVPEDAITSSDEYKTLEQIVADVNNAAASAQNSAAAAKNSETEAAKSAADAREIKDSLPADYTAMSGDVSTLKNQMQRAYPDDSTIGENPWSSKNIVDMLCPEIKESGNPVLCYPVAGYPLGVKASWEPVQEGSGTPYPAGGGKNQLNPAGYEAATKTVNGITFTRSNTGEVVVNGTATGTAIYVLIKNFSYPISLSTDRNWSIAGENVISAQGLVSGVTVTRPSDNTSLYIRVQSGTTVKTTVQPQIEKGNTPTAWEPYENIRPIKGRDSVAVERCGENLLNIKPFNKFAKNGITFEYVPDGGIHISGTALNNADGPTFPIWHLPPGKYSGLNMGKGIVASVVVQRNARNYWIGSNGVFEILAGDVCKYFYLLVTSGTTVDETVYPYIVPGTTAPTTYSPYTSQTNTLTLPETVYEGEVDAVSGEGQETWKMLTLDGTTNKFTQSAEFWKLPQNSAPGVVNDYDTICSHFPANIFGGNQKRSYIFTKANTMSKYFPDINALNAYISAQYAAGTPVKVCYKLVEPVPFTATGAQPIPAIAGLNTVMTDADSATVTGRADPIKRITDLEDAVASQT